MSSEPTTKRAESQIRLVCPFSSKRHTLAYVEGGEGVFVPYEPDDEVELPLGWGRMVIDQVVVNPEIKEVKTIRREEVKAGMAALKVAIKDESFPADHRKKVKAELDNGKALKETRRLARETYPLPDDETILVRMQFPVLSEEGIAEALKVLREAGFPIEVLGE